MSPELKYLITGGAGFIGSHLADELHRRGATLAILDDFSSGLFDNVARLSGDERVQIIDGSVLDEALVWELMSDCDACVHLASAVGVELIVDHPLDSLQSNVRGSDIVITAAAELDRRLVYTSSSEVYGKSTSLALREDSDRTLGSPFTARWSYAIAKTYGEALVHAYCRKLGFRGTVVRCFNTVGPRQTGAHGMVVPRLVGQALAGEDLTIHGTGRQTRCFIHVRDTVAAIALLLDDERTFGRAFNVGRPVEHSILDLAERILARTGSASKITLIPYEEAFGEGFEELGRRIPDISAISELTGWKPTLTLDDAIDDAIAHERARVADRVDPVAVRRRDE